ncbi:MAG: hypothetical protein QW156_01905 [Candidatus Aenigmatarchaeota archaeon]
MPYISLFTFDKMPDINNICKILNGKKSEDYWITAMASKYNKEEVFIQYWYYEDIEDSLKQVFEEEDAHEVISFLKQNGKNKVLKRIYCFINLQTRTLEIYRGPDNKTEKILKLFSDHLKVNFKPLVLRPHHLERILKYSEEINTAVFKNIHSLKLEIMKGDSLQENLKFQHHMRHFRNSLRAISFKPKIKYLNRTKYSVYLDGDKGILGFSENEIFKWRPRFEIRQIVQIIASCNGLLNSG